MDHILKKACFALSRYAMRRQFIVLTKLEKFVHEISLVKSACSVVAVGSIYRYWSVSASKQASEPLSHLSPPYIRDHV